MTKLQEIWSIKLKGTTKDRRSKNVNKDIVIYLYNHREEYGVYVKDIAELFGINMRTIYRMLDPEKHLNRERKNQKRIREEMGKEKISQINKYQRKQIIQYKTKLYNEIKSKEMKKANI